MFVLIFPQFLLKYDLLTGKLFKQRARSFFFFLRIYFLVILVTFFVYFRMVKYRWYSNASKNAQAYSDRILHHLHRYTGKLTIHTRTRLWLQLTREFKNDPVNEMFREWMLKEAEIIPNDCGDAVGLDSSSSVLLQVYANTKPLQPLALNYFVASADLKSGHSLQFPDGRIHIVQPGETLESIASSNKQCLDLLFRGNNIPVTFKPSIFFLRTIFH